MNEEINDKVAIISGTGSLPRFLSESLLKKNIKHLVVYFSEIKPTWTSPKVDMIFGEIEQIGKLFADLKSNAFTKIVFAGAFERPKLNLKAADEKFLALAPDISKAMKAGDDTILRLLIKIFENEGFVVIGAQDVLPSLFPPLGVLTDKYPSEHDKMDIIRARDIIDKLGEVDVGQACVVSNGLCFGLETIQGTEAMLRFVKNNSGLNVLSKKGKSGVFFKNIKCNQSRLIDVPVVGPDTIKQASNAKLNGIAIVHNNVFILDVLKTISLANKEGLFISVIAE